MAKKDNKKQEKVEIQIQITDTLQDDTKETWLTGTFTAKVPKSVAEVIPAPPSFDEIQVVGGELQAT